MIDVKASTTSRALFVILVAGLLGVGVWSGMGGADDLWLQKQAVDSAIEHHQAVVGEILRIDAGKRWSFDTLAILERGLRSQLARLDSVTGSDLFHGLPQILTRDVELVERFTTHHAVRRKSLEVLINPDTAESAFPAKYTPQIPTLLTRFTDARDFIDAAEALRPVLEDTCWLDQRFAGTKAHIKLFVSSQARCDTVLDQLLRSSTQARMLEVSNRLRELIQSNSVVLEFRQSVMLVLLASSLGYAGAMLLAQRNAASHLARANNNLEAAVAHRTCELDAERGLLRSILNSLPSAVFWKDLDGVYRGCNPAFVSMLGLGADYHIAGVTDDDLPWDAATIADKTATERAVLDTHQPVIDKPMRKSLETGRTYEVIASKTVLREQGGRPCGVVGVYTDVSELHQLRGELAQAEKLRAVGQLAAGIAHEINTPLQSASANIQYLKENIDAMLSVAVEGVSEAISDHREMDPKRLEHLRRNARGAIGDSSEALHRVTEIVRAMRIISHPGTRRYEATDLNTLLQSAATLTRNQWKYVAELDIDVDIDLPMAEVLTNEISQVFVNLIVNAGDAIAGSRSHDDPLGRITVRTRTDEDHVLIEVEDNGCGMSPEVRERIFEPFFTTKDVGKGTGQGLALAHGVVVTRHNGRIECDSEPGVGTTFRISLPLLATSTAVA